MEKILSVSIASYNVEKFIRKALDSCCIPEIMDRLEVLVVNDGSTDSTLEIAREYETKYPDTFRVIDKKNGGYGSTVNASIKAATGKYFRLLDGDDWFDRDGLVKFIGELSAAEEDMSFFTKDSRKNLLMRLSGAGISLLALTCKSKSAHKQFCLGC